MKIRRPVFIYKQAADDADGGTNEENSGTVKAPAEQALEGLLTRMGDANKVALHLLDENYRLRAKNRELQDKQVKENQAIVSSEDKAALDTYKVLGTPEILQQALGELQTVKRAEFIRKVADVGHFKPSVLSQLLKDEKVELRHETIDGKDVEVPWVLREGTEAVRLTDYAQTVWADFLPALQVTNQALPQGGQSTQFPRQVRGEKVQADDPVAAKIAAIQERAQRPNPLNPAKE